MGLNAPAAVVVLFLATYALWRAPEGSAPLSRIVSAAALVLLPVMLMARRIREIMIAVEPYVEVNTTAVFIAGCDHSAGWFTALRYCELGVRVYGTFEDPSAEASQWLQQYGGDNLVPLRLSADSVADARAAAKAVQDSLDGRPLVAAVYAIGSAPKIVDSLDIDEIQRGIELNALGVVNVSQAFGPILQNFGGRFVVLTDMAGRVTIPSVMPYCVAQTVAQQIITAIRKDMEKLNVTVHVVEPLLNIWDCIQRKEFYPGVSEDGKVIICRKAQKIDYDIFDVSQSINHACFSKSPQDRYFPTINDVIMDKVINYGPRCLLNWTIRHVEDMKQLQNPVIYSE